METPQYAIWFGRLLVAVGIIGYGYGLYAGNASLTAMIPAVFGVILMLLGHLSNAKESLRKHLMHAAVLIAAIGAFLPFFRLVTKISELSVSAAVISQVAMSVICLAFVVIAVQSFIGARRAA